MYRVLLVDDEILVRTAMRENIEWEKLGFELAGDCANGKEAIAFVQEHPVDVVLTDICMPYVDGMELSRFLYENYPEIVIVVFSGFGEFEYAQKAIQYRVSEYLLKPVTATELTELLTRIRRKLEQERRQENRLRRMEHATEEYHKNMDMIRSQAISDLVTGTSDPEQCLNRLQRLDIVFRAEYYRVAAVEIDTYSEFCSPDDKERQESSLMAFVVGNIAGEILRGCQAGIAYQESSNCIYIIFETNRRREFMEKCSRICRQIQDKVQEVMKLEISIGVGTYVRSPEELHLSYASAKAALGYRYLLGSGMILDMETERGEEISIYEDLREIAGNAKAGKSDDLIASMEKVRIRIRSALVGKSRACMYLQQIVRTLAEVQESMLPDDGKGRQQGEDILNRLIAERTFDRAFDVVKEYAVGVAEKLGEQNATSGSRQARMALDYIGRNYSDPDLSLNSVCSYIGISTSHFSTIFKEETGSTFMEVLTGMRMEKAKELLENTTLKNYEIAERVGFSDPHYFGIAFKKMTGRTPTEYAKARR